MASDRTTMRTPSETVIAGRRTIHDWHVFRPNLVLGHDVALWEKAFKDFFHARLLSRYLRPIETLQENSAMQGEGFSIVAIQCSLIEFLESTVQGKRYIYSRNGIPPLGKYDYSNSANMFESFLVRRTPFNGGFTKQLAHEFYVSVRCGVLHEARTKNGWTILANSKTGKIIDADLKILYRNS